MKQVEETYWRAVLARDATFDGRFVYGVRSTNIYCRPTCASRRPNRENVAFFVSAQVATVAGFRACKRCGPNQLTAPDPARDKVIEACRFIETYDGVPDLTTLGTHVGLSPSHLQRVFKRIVGVSPWQYADALRAQRLRQHLQDGKDVSTAAYDVGFGSSSRVYERSANHLGMTPATYRRQGAGQEIRYTFMPSPLGLMIVAATERGICSVRFGERLVDLERELRSEFQGASLILASEELHGWTTALLTYLRGGDWPDLPYDIRATAFQIRVWDELRRIASGATSTYGDVAEAIGMPNAVRAVARACATNPAALVIPCHRVVPKARGDVGGYRWGAARKRALLALEQDRTATPEAADDERAG